MLYAVSKKFMLPLLLQSKAQGANLRD